MVKRDQNSWQPDAGNVSGEGEMSQNAGICIQTALCDGSGPEFSCEKMADRMPTVIMTTMEQVDFF